jgi:glutaconate CoA-transferase subunit A
VCEEIVDEAAIRADPNRTVIPGLIVDAVVEEPRACHPSFAQGYYDRDNKFYVDWDKISRDPQALESWLDEWVYAVASHADYVDKLGEQRWNELTPAAAWSEPVNYGRYE